MARHRAPLTRRWSLRRSQAQDPVADVATPAADDPTPTAAASPIIATVPAALPDADNATTGVMPRIRDDANGAPTAVMEPVPSAPSRVTLHYPDGHTHALDCLYDGPSAFDSTRHRWIAVVPDEARLVNGMVVRVDRQAVLAVALRDRTVTA